jgi:hypothetical protein
MHSDLHEHRESTPSRLDSPPVLAACEQIVSTPAPSGLLPLAAPCAVLVPDGGTGEAIVALKLSDFLSLVGLRALPPQLGLALDAAGGAS